MSSSRSLSGELLCLYSVELDSRFQLVSFWLPILCERPRLARRLDDVLSSASSAAPPCALSEPEWWKSWRRFSKLRAHGPSFCQFTLWKAMMQCRLPPTCEQGSFLSVRLRLRTVYIISDILKKKTAVRWGTFLVLRRWIPLSVWRMSRYSGFCVLRSVTMSIHLKRDAPRSTAHLHETWPRLNRDRAYFLQWIAGCFLLGSPIRIQYSISFVGRGPLYRKHNNYQEGCD